MQICRFCMKIMHANLQVLYMQTLHAAPSACMLCMRMQACMHVSACTCKLCMQSSHADLHAGLHAGSEYTQFAEYAEA